MRGKRSPGALAKTSENIDDAGWEASLVDKLREAQSRHRGLFSKFKHDGTAAGKCRSQLPGGHQEREVPGNDLGDDAYWFPQGVGVKIGTSGERQTLARYLRGPAGHITEHIDGKGNVGDARYGIGFAIVEGFQFGEFLKVLLKQIAELPKQAPALRRRHTGPCAVVEGTTGCKDGEVDILFFRFRDVGEHFASGGIVDRKSFA